MAIEQANFMYNDVHKVYICRTEQMCRYRIIIDLKTLHGASNQKALSVQLTDDEDATFLFSLLLTQDDYAVLKNQQGLHADFESFPKQLARLLHDCISPEKPQLTILMDSMDALDYSTSTQTGLYFKIVEKNDFKNLCHLSLRMAPGSDTDIKCHMSNKLKFLQRQLTDEITKSSKLEEKLQDALQNLSSSRSELDSIKLRMTEECSSAKVAASREVAAEKERLANVEKEFLTRSESERTRLQSQHKAEIQELLDKISIMTHSNANLIEAKCHAETALKEKSALIESLRAELTRLREEASAAERRACAAAAADESQRAVAAALERARVDLATAQAHAMRCENTLRERDVQLHRTHCALQQATADGAKIQQVVAALKDELNAKRNKLTCMVSIGEKLEKKIERLSCVVTQLETELAKEKEKNSKMTQVAERLSELEKQLSESDATIKRQDGVINYLHRKLTEIDLSQTPQIIASDLKKIVPKEKSENVFDSKLTSLSSGKIWPPWVTSSSVQGSVSADSAVSLGALTINNTDPSRSENDPSYLVPPLETIKPGKPILKSKHSTYFPQKSER